MNRCRLSPRKHEWQLLAATALAGAGLMLAGPPVLAQPMETVVVTAPRIVQQTIVLGRSPTGAPMEETTISRTVKFADLDLTKPQDQDTLRTRVRDTSKDLCAELDKLYPFAAKDPDCVRKSADRAMVQVDQAIGEAHK